MRILFTLDKKDYDVNYPVIDRIGVRGIIFKDNKLLMIEDKYGHCKFPGGGQEDLESDVDTLIREVKEETGYLVIKESIAEYGEVIEKRKSRNEDKIWCHRSHYYFCDVSEISFGTEYTNSEKKYGMHVCFLTIDEAIKNNMEDNSNLPWNEREYELLKLLKKEKNV